VGWIRRTNERRASPPGGVDGRSGPPYIPREHRVTSVFALRGMLLNVLRSDPRRKGLGASARAFSVSHRSESERCGVPQGIVAASDPSPVHSYVVVTGTTSAAPLRAASAV